MMKWVPISFCQFVIENDAYNAGKIFCYLKHHTDGKSNISDLNKARRYFDVSKRTIRRWLRDAEHHNWIGRFRRRLFIHGWQMLFDFHHFRKKACFHFRKKDLKDFKTYCFAAVMCYLGRVQIRELERISGRSTRASIWTPLSSSAISKILNVPESTAQFYRKRAVKSNYIKKKENLKLFGIKVSEVNRFRKYSPYDNVHLVVRKGKVYQQLPDSITYNIKLVKTVRRFKNKFYRNPE